MDDDVTIDGSYRLEVNRRELAALFRVSEKTVFQWMGENPPLPAIACGVHGQDNRHDVSACVAWLVDHELRKAGRQSEKEAYYRVRRQREELALAREQNAVVDLDEIRQSLASAVTATRTLLLQLPERIASALEVTHGFEARRDMLREEIEQALQTLAGYDPARPKDDPFGIPE